MDRFLGRLNNSFTKLWDKLEAWLDAAVVSLPNILLALVVSILTFLVYGKIKKYVGRVLSQFSMDKTLMLILTNLFATAFLILMLLVVLTILDLDSALKSTLAGAGIAGLAVGLALQEPLVNLFSGVIMSTQNHFKIGDLVSSNGFMGTITGVNYRATMVRTLQGQEVAIPNKLVIQNPLQNYSSSGERRVDLPCGVTYGSDLEKVKELAVQAVEEQVAYDSSREVNFYYTGYGSSSIDFVVQFWLHQQKQPNFLRARSEAIIAIKKKFDEHGITIPFPIRTLEFNKSELKINPIKQSPQQEEN